MDARQERRSNPFGMDEDCRNCPALCDTRSRVVHGYGDVGADFLFVGERPSARADRTGIPFASDGDGPDLWSVLERVGLCDPDPTIDGTGDGTSGGADGTSTEADGETGGGTDGLPSGNIDDSERPPTVENAFLTHLTRCRDPDRPPSDEEVRNCEPFLNAEVRSINPEILVPVGARALRAVAAEYTTRDAGELELDEAHAETIRGRGFEVLPTVDPREATDAQREAFVEAFSGLLGRDYRQTKGRRGR